MTGKLQYLVNKNILALDEEEKNQGLTTHCATDWNYNDCSILKLCAQNGSHYICS